MATHGVCRARRAFLAALSCVALLQVGATADEYVHENPMIELQQMQRNARRAALRTNSDLADGDTVWVGHVVGTHNVPWSSNPSWSGHGPFHVGRGGYRVTTSPSSPVTVANNGYWDFDRFNPGETDTLQGWNAVPMPYQTTYQGSDWRYRYAWCLDYGNAGNHRGTAGKATYGVTGYWHVDGGSTAMAPAIANTSPIAPAWTPIAGTGSAWCGLRAHGDTTYRDPQTGQWYNASIVQNYGDNHFRPAGALNPTGFTDANYPGYGSQWDQLLYRDFAVADGGSLTVSFDYRTALSTGKANDAFGEVYGWYHGDPLKVPTLNDGNFISATVAGVNAPRDSFMVYVGVPVNDAAWIGAAGGAAKPVYDPQRRWFSEILDINAPYRRVLGRTGVMVAPAGSGLQVLPNSVIQPMLDAQPGPGGFVRLVFRVKTDRAWDDEDTYERGFNSGTVGAVLIDNVAVDTGSGPDFHGFDSPDAIDNAIATPPSTTWKSTGKPVAAHWHWHNLGAGPYTSLIYADPCGPVGGSFRVCNMAGNAIVAGDHDFNDRSTGPMNEWRRERADFFISPTINLMASGNGPGFYNEMGIDQEIADALHDIRVRFDVYTHGFDFVNNGGGIRVAWNTYPMQQTNGVKCWGQRKPSQFTSYTFTYGCFASASPSGANGKIGNLIKTSNASGIPDSIQVVIEYWSRCNTNNSFPLQCGNDQSDPAGGGYIDNIAIGFIDTPAPAPISMAPWNVLQDAFPYNGVAADAAVGTPAFDRLTCLTKTGFNTSTPTGGLSRPVIAGDSMYVVAPGSTVRMDLVFRVYPGPGNYVTIGDRLSGLCQSTPVNGCTPATEGDGSWWGTLMNDVGLFGTCKNPGSANVAGGAPYRMRDVNGGRTAANDWDPNVWISVRMDTLERVTNDASVVAESYMSTIHERDYSSDPTDIDPDHSRRAALAANEGMKILPNNLFTPGTHIEYFFRRALVGNTIDYAMVPDTTAILPQPMFAGGHWDGIRFATWDALPDRWKDPGFPGNAGTPTACMLVANYGSRRGDLVVWDNLARAIGLTRVTKWGAGHGYWSSPYADYPIAITDPEVQPANGGAVVSANLGHEGSAYDVYDVVGGDSNVPAGRLGNRTALGGCPTPTGPTRKLLRSYYRNLIVLAADLGSNLLGPFTDQTDDDAGLITDFITNNSPNVTRLVTMSGMDIGSGLDGASASSSMMNTHFGTLLKADDYRTDSGSMDDFPDLLTAGSPIITTGAIYGVYSPCASLTDAFDVNPATPTATAAAFYENTGIADPWPAAIYMPENLAGGRQARTLIMGWTFGLFGSPDLQGGQQGSRFTAARDGLIHLWLNMLANTLQGCPSIPTGIGDLPGQDGTPFVSFLGLRSENPVRHGTAKLVFGVERTERVEVHIYDVSGRQLRKLADRVFQGGKSHELTWDGADDAGRRLGSGIYFYRVRSGSFTGQKKLTVLRD